MEKKLIVFTHGGGRMANQLTNFAHLISFYEENKAEFEIISIPFWRYSSLFQSFTLNKICGLPHNTNRFQILNILNKIKPITRLNTFYIVLAKLIHLYGNLKKNWQCILKNPDIKNLKGTNIEEFNLNDEEFIEILKLKNVSCLSGWPIRCWGLFEKYQDLLRIMFKPNQKYVDIAEKFVSPIRKKFEVVIGVFIRQTDYQYWLNGKYFFETEQYLNWMKQCFDIFSNKKIAFIITTDSKPDKRQFSISNTFFATGNKFGNGHYMENFCELALCDYILTPPSTFSAWAAFIGNKAMIAVYKKNQKIEVQDIFHHHIFDAIKHPSFSESIK